MFATVLKIKFSKFQKKKKKPNISGLVTTTFLNTKISETEIKVTNYDKYITSL